MEITWSADGPRGQGDGRGRITRKYVDFNELSDIVDAESMIRRVIGRWTRLDVSCHLGGAGTATRPDGRGLSPPPPPPPPPPEIRATLNDHCRVTMHETSDSYASGQAEGHHGVRLPDDSGCLAGVFWLQFDLSPLSAGLPDHALHLLPVIIVIQGIAFQIFGLHRYLWRFVSTPVLVRVVQAVVAGSLACALCVSFLSAMDFAGMNSVSYTSFVIFGLLLVVLLSGPRVLRRWFNDRRLGKAGTRRVLIVGAGRGGRRSWG